MADVIAFLNLNSANVRFVLLGTFLIGITGGGLGTFAVLRKRSLMGDALAHASLPGVAIAFILTGSKDILVLLSGATFTGILGVLSVQWIVRNSRIKSDAAIGIVLSVFFGIGIVLLTYIQHHSFGNQSGLDKFLFGQAAAMLRSDIYVMIAGSLIVFGTVAIFFKELKAYIFDEGFMDSAGFSAKWIDIMLMGLIVLVVMIGIQAVGVILIAAMLITPAVAARFWSNKFNVMFLLSIIFGGISGVTGTIISASVSKVPTGPVMVLTATLIFIISAMFAPEKGIFARWRGHAGNRAREREHHILRALWELREENTGKDYFSETELFQHMQHHQKGYHGSLKKMVKEGLLGQSEDKKYKLDPAGHAEAEKIIKSHRLWEYYLQYKSILPADHVDRAADELEHILTPEIISHLETILAEEKADNGSIKSAHSGSSGYRKRGVEDV